MKDIRIWKKNVTIIFYKISFAFEIIPFLKQVKNQSNHIKALWFRAHGSPTNISFNEYDCDNLSCGNPIIKEFPIFLDQDGIIILECCSIGQTILPDCSSVQIENIAQNIARFSNGRSEYAPSREMVSIDKTISYENGWKVIMEGIKSSPYSHFLGRIHALWLMKMLCKENITMKFQM